MSAEQATLGGGCFWCLEAAYQRLRGVKSVVSGYAGGHTDNPTFQQVWSGETGHAEVTQIEFDPAEISFTDLLDVFWVIHDPTTLNRQGNDIGTEYRSIILYANETQRKEAERSIKTVQTLWDDPVVTELKPLERFYPAEAEHQDYFNRNPANPYCAIVINPKLAKLRAKFASRLKD